MKGFWGLKPQKCEFMQLSVDYHGDLFDAQGFTCLKARKSQLRSYLGLLNCYGKFIPHLATMAYLLHCLLCHQQKWSWDDKHAGAFAATKHALVSSDILIHYDPNLPLTFAGDTSANGLGAVLSHTLPDGIEYPIVFASQLKEIILNWRKRQHH